MSHFWGDAPSIEDYWRGIILFGKNVASYKFALAQSLLELAPGGKSIITLDELAEPFARHTLEHLRVCDSQSQQTNVPYPFLEACRRYDRGEISYEELISITAKEGFKVVLDKFHNVNQAETPLRFFAYEHRGAKAIALTDELFRMLESERALNLPAEVDARWRLVETAWELKVSRHLINVDCDADLELLFVQRPMSRVNITSCRGALNGYQKGKCFYCFGEISIISSAADLTDVDHFFPRVLINYRIAHPVDGIWNLVLACVSCNRGMGGKFDQLPHQRYLERLHTRNEFLIGSHHPLKETLIQQTGNSEPKRRSFLERNYNAAKTGRLINSNWQPAFEHPPAF
ncbi:HNH endonuclease domain-containing protein [Microcoleus sp. S36b_A4]|uniref:hypothetical protein n=1 Tax=Microcoleus sp. S36b_A4 TaxID=3055420 RepID=UPI002FCFC609